MLSGLEILTGILPSSTMSSMKMVMSGTMPSWIMPRIHTGSYSMNSETTASEKAVIVEEHFVDAVLDEGSIVDRCVWYVNQADLNERRAQPEARRVKPREHDWETLQRFFGWASVDLVERTFQAMMQMGRLSNAVHLKKHYRSPNPALSVHHHQEPVATDYVYANVPAVDDGSMGAQSS